MYTYDELCVRIIEQVDMIELLELLNITTEDIVERYEDRILANQDDIQEFLND